MTSLFVERRPLLHCPFLQQLRHLRGQQLDPRIQSDGADVGDGMRADDVGEARHAHQLRVGLGCRDEYIGDDGGGGETQPLQGNSVVQTARRAAPSIADAGDNQVGVAVQFGHHLRLWRKRRAVLLDIKDF